MYKWWEYSDLGDTWGIKLMYKWWQYYSIEIEWNSYFT